MFYLLDDNKIYKAELFEKHKMLKIKTDWNVIYKSTSHIKEQSENVFELIKAGDLISFKYDENSTIVGQVTDVIVSNGKVKILIKNHIINTKDIYCIFKPDEDGNYIKTWEV